MESKNERKTSCIGFIRGRATGCTDLGYFPTIRLDRAKGKATNLLIQEEIREGEEEKIIAKMVELSQQGA